MLFHEAKVCSLARLVGWLGLRRSRKVGQLEPRPEDMWGCGFRTQVPLNASAWTGSHRYSRLPSCAPTRD